MCSCLYLEDRLYYELQSSLKQSSFLISAPQEQSSLKKIYPGQKMLVWTSSNALQILRWGYQKWNHKGRVLHARWETAGTSIFFHQNHSRRGILCVSGYFEWSTQKEQYYFHRQSPLYLGILYNDQGEFVILTVAAMMPYQRIHPRMPVVFSRQQAYDFLEHQPIKKEALDLHVSKVQ